MKRNEALTEIKWAGWHGDYSKCAAIATQKGIGRSSARKAYADGQKMKSRREPCGCASCKGDKRSN